MLRRLDLKSEHRSLAPGFWPNDVPFGKRTIVYGHNGSGKSTLSHLLLRLASGDSPVDVVWESAGSSAPFRISRGRGLSEPSIAVFTKDWVDRNLSAFLEGDSASAIVTLGEEAIGAKGDETRLEREISELAKSAKESDAKKKDVSKRIDTLIREVQESISSQLQEFDYRQFTKNRWSVPTVKARLTDYAGDFPSQDDHANALKRLGEGELSPVQEIPALPADPTATIAELGQLLEQSPDRVAIDALAADPRLQQWVEQGLALHESLTSCTFCGGDIAAERRVLLAQHFDRSWLQIRGRAESMARQLRADVTGHRNWLEALPGVDLMGSEVRDSYRAQVALLGEAVATKVAKMNEIIEMAERKWADPSIWLRLPDWSCIKEPLPTAPIVGAILAHNDEAADHQARKERLIATVLDHLLGSKSSGLRGLAAQLDNAVAAHDRAETAARLGRRALEDLKQKQFSSSAMAEILTKDLARVYGKHHLTVAVTPDGKSYACRRAGNAATNLSTGERTTLSLLYFLRKLEDENEITDQGSRIVVIDDPSSSLDREAVFATHQWLLDTLGGFGQYVILTHDFNLLRLFIKSQTNQWNKALSEIQKGNANEKRFPRVAFLEMYASINGTTRTSRLAELPRMLKESSSEYAYLFSMVMHGVSEGPSSDRLFLLPNAARRVLEVFCSYKSPHIPKFEAQLRSLIAREGESVEPYRDVYDFCNRYSHGEGGEVIDVLDGRAVHGQIRRCMEFLKYVDAEHYDRMCKAVKCDPESV